MPDKTFPKEAQTFLEETNYFFTTKTFLDRLAPFYSILPKRNESVIFRGPSSDVVAWLLELKSGERIQVIPQDIRCLEVPRIYDLMGTLIPQLSFPNRAIKTEGIVDVPLYLRDIGGKVMRLFQANNTSLHTKYNYVFPDGMVRVVDDIYQFDIGDAMEWLGEYCRTWNIGGDVSKPKKPDEDLNSFLERTNYFFVTKSALNDLSVDYNGKIGLGEKVVFRGTTGDGISWLLELKSGDMITAVPPLVHYLQVPRIFLDGETPILEKEDGFSGRDVGNCVEVPLYTTSMKRENLRFLQRRKSESGWLYTYITPQLRRQTFSFIPPFELGNAVAWLKENEAFKSKLEEANMLDVNGNLISDKSSATKPAGLLPTKPAEDQQEMEQVYIVKHDIPAGGFVSESLKKGDILIPVPVEHATLTYARYPSGKVFNVDPMNIETISRPKPTALVVVEKKHKRPAKDIVGFRPILKDATGPSAMFGWAYDYRGDRYWSMITPSGKPELGILAGTAPFEPIYRDELSECAQRAYYSTIGVCGYRLLRVARDGTEDFISITDPTSPLLNDPTIVLDGETFTHPELEPRYLKAVQYPYMDQLCKKGGIILYRVLEDIRDIDDADIHWPAGTILFRFADMPTEDGINILTLMDSTRNITRIPAESVEKESGVPVIKVESSLMDKLIGIFTSKSMKSPNGVVDRR